MGHRNVGEREPDHHEDQDRGELGTFSKGTDDQAAGDGCEGTLEDHEGQLGDDDTLGKSRTDRFRRDALQEELVQRAEELVALGECRRVAVDHPEQGNQREHGEHLHQHRQHVLAADETAVEQRKTRNRHQDDQRSADHHPGVIALVGHQRRCGCRRGFRGGGGGGCSSRGGCRLNGSGCDRGGRLFFSPGRRAEGDGADQGQ